MYFTRALIALGLMAATASACTPGTFACGNQGQGGVDGEILVCTSSGNFVESAQCGGATCCQITDGGFNAHCTC